MLAGDITSYAVTANGEVYGWGYNYYGGLGIGYTTSSSANPYPLKMLKVNNAMQISAGEIHIAVLNANGTIWMSGYNGYGGLGIGNTSSVSYPQLMKTADGKEILNEVKEVSTGRHTTFILKKDSTVWSTRI